MKKHLEVDVNDDDDEDRLAVVGLSEPLPPPAPAADDALFSSMVFSSLFLISLQCL